MFPIGGSGPVTLLDHREGYDLPLSASENSIGLSAWGAGTTQLGKNRTFTREMEACGKYLNHALSKNAETTTSIWTPAS